MPHFPLDIVRKVRIPGGIRTFSICFGSRLLRRGQGVFFRVGVEPAAVVAIAVAHVVQRLVEVQVVLGRVDNAAGDVGAVIGGTLQIRQQVAPDEARLDAAAPCCIRRMCRVRICSFSASMTCSSGST